MKCPMRWRRATYACPVPASPDLRRRLSISTPVAVLAGWALLLSSTQVAYAADAGPGAGSATAPAAAAAAAEDRAAAEDALAQVQAMLGSGDARTPRRGARDATPHDGHDLTLALRDLGFRLDDLSPSDRREARGFLARPTGYYEYDFVTYEPGFDLQSECGPEVCVHWVEEGPHAPSLLDEDEDGVPDQVSLTLETVEDVWERTLAMGYRAPLDDDVDVADPDGEGRFDVYLADVGSIEPIPLFGYCAWESKDGYDYAGAGYCVLDDDYASDQFGGADPVESLRVTAAHEFFHAVQFGYDAVEDLWFMEATATWIEDELFDDLDGNRDYLEESQLYFPEQPLDAPRAALGNWVFFRWLSERYGPQIVLQAWRQADSVGSAPDLWGLLAVGAALRSRGTALGRELARYAVDLRFAEQVFAEAGEDARWAAAPAAELVELTRRERVRELDGLRLRQTASMSLEVPTSRRTSRMRRLLVTVDTPPRRRGVRVKLVQERTDGSRAVQPVRLDRTGAGSARIGFARGRVERIHVVLAGTSIRMRCWEGTRFSCEGERLDDRLRVDVRLEGRR